MTEKYVVHISYSDSASLVQGQAADLSDKIRMTLARIGRGNPSPDDAASIKAMIDDRIELAVKRGLLAAKTRAEQAAVAG